MQLNKANADWHIAAWDAVKLSNDAESDSMCSIKRNTEFTTCLASSVGSKLVLQFLIFSSDISIPKRPVRQTCLIVAQNKIPNKRDMICTYRLN